MFRYKALSTQDNHEITLVDQLRTKLPHVMRDQLNLQTQPQAYFLLTMLSDDPRVNQLRDHLLEQYPPIPSSKTSLEQGLALITQLRNTSCSHNAPFKYRLPSFLGEYPIHSRNINSKINQFNQLIEQYYADPVFAKPLNDVALNEAYQALLLAIEKHHIGCTLNSLWHLLKALSAWSAEPIENLLRVHPGLLSPSINATETVQPQPDPLLSTQPVNRITQPISASKQANPQPFTANFNYTINEAGRLEQSNYLLLNGFALKPGGHTDALTKKVPDFLPWAQWQCIIRRQLSQLIELPADDEFFDWLQTVLQRLGIEFITLQSSSYKCYISPFLNHKTTLAAMNEEMVLCILQEQCEQTEVAIEATHLPIISRYLIRFLHQFQFNRGLALGIGANWGGVVSDSNEAGADAFRFNDSEWASHFKNLSIHRQGPAEAYMNAAIGVKYELGALLSNFEYMTQLQPSEHTNTLYNALVDNLVTELFPEPPYFENAAYTKYRRHYAVAQTDHGMQQITFFYQPDPQGTYFKDKKGEYKQTPMFRQAGSLVVEPFPRDTASSGDCFQSLSVANPLWPLQLQYAQSSSNSMRGHIVYNPIGPDEFIPDTFYGQIIRESDEVFVPFIGVIPKNFDKNFKQIELCASFVIRMLQSSRLMTYCPAFNAYYCAILTRFLPLAEANIPPLPGQVNVAIKRKWQALEHALHDPERTATACHKALFALFKELIYSLYSVTKEDVDLHYYFVELTTSPDALQPQNRATCERLIRELTTLKPLLTPSNANSRQYYDAILHYLSELTGFFYPNPSDETAKSVAQQARLHAQSLLTLPEIKAYFSDLSKQHQANISPRVSPGLMHDAIKYQRPSPEIRRDLYRRRHETNFHSGFRDVDGNQIVRPSSREKLLDKTIKTIGALLPLIYRDKSIFSLITQPFSQAFIMGRRTYYTQERYKTLLTILSGVGGFIYGTALGTSYALKTLPIAIYDGWFAPTVQQQKANHILAISAAPGNEAGLHVKAVMAIRDHLLQLIATANTHETSIEQLISLLVTHVKQIHPSLLSGKMTTQERYQQILLETFPLSAAEWQHLFEPVISVGSNKALQQIINQYALQIDCALVYALYECLTAPNCEQDTKKVIKDVTDKHKLSDLQDKALAALVNYYASNPAAKRKDMAQYNFHGPTIKKLKQKEQSLRKIQTWMNKALDIQWGLESFLTRFMDQYKILLNRDTLATIVSQLPDGIKEVFHQLLSQPEHETHVLKKYQLDESQKAFLLQCSSCYREISSEEKQNSVMIQIGIRHSNDSSLSVKAREHLKLNQFIRREWHHQLLSISAIEPIIEEIKRQVELPDDREYVDELDALYKTCLENIKNTKTFDTFYFMAVKIRNNYSVESPLCEWINVTMNAFVNCLLDEATWFNDKDINPLNDSLAVAHWLKHLMTYKDGIRSLLTQQIEQAPSLDHAAWRCQHILHVLEKLQPNPRYIRNTGMQKLLRIIGQNTNRITPTGEQQAKEVPIATLCKYSITMQHALGRIREKIPEHDFVRAIDVRLT
jgi:hypothetical protein